MKFDKYLSFFKHLESSGGHLSSLYIVLMPHIEERKEVLKVILSYFKKFKPSLHVEHFQAEGLEQKDFLEAFETCDLFAKEQLVAIDSIEKCPKAVFESLVQYLEKEAALPCILIGQQLPDPKAYERLKNTVVMVNLSQEKPWERHDRVKHWALEYINQASKKVEMDALEYLMEVTQHDFTAMKQEIDKWICFSIKKTTLDLQDLKVLCQLKVSSRQWAISESIIWGFDVKLVRESLDFGSQPAELMTMLGGLRYQVQLGLHMKELELQGESLEKTQEAYPQLQLKSLQRYSSVLGKLPLQFFTKALTELMQVELQFKTTSLDSKALWSQLIMKLHELKRV